MAEAARAEPRKPSTLRKLAQRRLALFGLVLMVIFIGGALFAPWLAPHDPNEQFFDGLTIEGARLRPEASSGSAPTFWDAISSRGFFTARGPR
ncbi:hypothetical protein [Paracoccus cavernae]|uniref:hypothetical protein n=1 Tax=Paracoccus cavernae TaxID=1571207 RepID=UPI003635E32A